jgi:hypothetical protein
MTKCINKKNNKFGETENVDFQKKNH